GRSHVGQADSFRKPGRLVLSRVELRQVRPRVQAILVQSVLLRGVDGDESFACTGLLVFPSHLPRGPAPSLRPHSFSSPPPDRESIKLIFGITSRVAERSWRPALWSITTFSLTRFPARHFKTRTGCRNSCTMGSFPSAASTWFS